MKTSILAAGMIAVLCGSALAQTAQPVCKGYYTVGETVPAGCTQQTINASNYMSWDNGKSAATAPVAVAPSLFDARGRGFMGR